MTVRLLNSAMMPRPGIYSMVVLTKEEFADYIRQANEQGILQSYIGYEDAAKIIKQLSGVTVSVCRDSTPIDDGDTMLVAKLKYRVGNPQSKGSIPVTIDDYEFFLVHFTSHTI